MDEIDVLKKELNHSTWASIVLDHWSSQDNKNYIGVIVNFLDKNIEFKSKMVDFHNVKEHGATFTHETLLDLMKNLNIQTKLAGIVGDSTISMVQTMEKTAFSSNSFPHVCFLHVFQLCIRVALSDSDNDPVYKALSALKKRVNYMRNSCKFVYFAQEKAKSENVPFIMPKKENLTRWDSTFFMIESVVTQLGFLDACLTEFAQQEKSNSNIPSAIGDRHGYTLFELYKTLSMFRNVTIEGQRTDRSIGSLIPMYHYVEKCCFIAQDHTDEFIRKIGRTVLVEFDFRVNQHYKRDEKWKTEYIIAAFLDKSNNQFLKKLDAHGTMKQTFIDCVNITAS